MVDSSNAIPCSGELSCFNSTQLTAYSYCSGSLSCYQSKELRTLSSNRANCHGAMSCAESMLNITQTNGEGIACLGDSSCYGSTIYIVDQNVTDTSLSCSGTSSCENTIIYLGGRNSIQFGGFRSGFGASVYTSTQVNGTTTTITCRGVSSCQNATFYCGINSTCDVAVS